MTARAADLSLAQECAQRLRERLGSNLVGVTLFGSRARGAAKAGSDFDLVVVVRSRTAEVRETVLDVDVEMMDTFGELFCAMVLDEAEWSTEREAPFGWNVMREGIAV